MLTSADLNFCPTAPFAAAALSLTAATLYRTLAAAAVAAAALSLAAASLSTAPITAAAVAVATTLAALDPTLAAAPFAAAALSLAATAVATPAVAAATSLTQGEVVDAIRGMIDSLNLPNNSVPTSAILVNISGDCATSCSLGFRLDASCPTVNTVMQSSWRPTANAAERKLTALSQTVAMAMLKQEQAGAYVRPNRLPAPTPASTASSRASSADRAPRSAARAAARTSTAALPPPSAVPPPPPEPDEDAAASAEAGSASADAGPAPKKGLALLRKGGMQVMMQQRVLSSVREAQRSKLEKMMERGAEHLPPSTALGLTRAGSLEQPGSASDRGSGSARARLEQMSSARSLDGAAAAGPSPTMVSRYMQRALEEQAEEGATSSRGQERISTGRPLPAALRRASSRPMALKREESGLTDPTRVRI